MKMLDNKSVRSLGEIKEHVKEWNKESIFASLHRMVEDIITNEDYDVFIGTGYEWEEIMSTDGYLEAVDEFRGLPEYETDVILVDGIKMLAIKVVPM